MLRTGFEALVGDCDTTDKAARLLSGIYDQLGSNPETSAISTAHLLWSPDEETNLTFAWMTRSGKPRQAQLTPLEHWFRSFSEERNNIVHRGASGLLPTAKTPPTGARTCGRPSAS